MNKERREKITEMRKGGFGYKRIAKDIGIPLDTVKSFCRSNKLTGYKGGSKHPTVCRECHQALVQPEKKKPIKFCSSVCRVNWWKKNQSKDNRKTALSIECQGCEKVFMAYEHEHRKYCSHSCYIATRFGEIKMNEKANNEPSCSKTAEHQSENRSVGTSQVARCNPHQTKEIEPLELAEMNYRLSKIVVDYMWHEKLLTNGEQRAAIQLLINQFNPWSAILEPQHSNRGTHVSHGIIYP